MKVVILDVGGGARLFPIDYCGRQTPPFWIDGNRRRQSVGEKDTDRRLISVRFSCVPLWARGSRYS